VNPAPDGVESFVPQRPKHLQLLLNARGIGVEMAKGIDPDEYIQRLREDWD
jgi:hypothetical protein